MARAAKPPKFQRNRNPATWALRHAQMSLSSLGRLSRSPIGTLMTAAVIGIALAMPSGLHLLVDNVRQLSSSWDGSASISLFLNDDVSDEQAEAVRRQVALRPDVAETRLIDRAQALEEFAACQASARRSNCWTRTRYRPWWSCAREHVQGAAAVSRMATELQAYREIELAQVDLQWVERLSAITGTIERGVVILAVLLSGAVLLIVGNTGPPGDPESAQRDRDRQTGRWHRRLHPPPFSSTGIWYGLLGAGIALSLVLGSLYLLDSPVKHLAGLYESQFSLAVIDPLSLFGMVFGGPLLGLAGAWLAVSRHLADIQPE